MSHFVMYIYDICMYLRILCTNNKPNSPGSHFSSKRDILFAVQSGRRSWIWSEQINFSLNLEESREPCTALKIASATCDEMLVEILYRRQINRKYLAVVISRMIAKHILWLFWFPIWQLGPLWSHIVQRNRKSFFFVLHFWLKDVWLLWLYYSYISHDDKKLWSRMWACDIWTWKA
jgi:hypothetical protein